MSVSVGEASSSSRRAEEEVDSSDPVTETALLVRSDDEGEEVEEESENESEGDWRVSAANVRLFRFKPGLWLKASIPKALFLDITNYPYAVRESIVECVQDIFRKSSTIDTLSSSTLCRKTVPAVSSSPKPTAEPKPATNENQPNVNGLEDDEEAIQTALHSIFCLTEASGTIDCTPDALLPRFVWYRRELETLYGPDYVRESFVDERSGFKPKLPTLEIIEDRKDDDGLVEVNPYSQDLSSTDIHETPSIENLGTVLQTEAEIATEVFLETSGTNETLRVQSPTFSSKKKKRKLTFSFQALPTSNQIPSTASGEGPLPQSHPGAVTDRTDPFSMALKEIQFRLSRHGTVGDPRDYFGKGEGMMDKDDPFLDDEEMMAEIGLSKEDLEADERSEEGGDSGSDDSEGGEDEEDVYANTEDRFFIDNDSEAEVVEDEIEDKEDVKKGIKKKRKLDQSEGRIIKKVDFAKPSQLPLVYNPKAWRQAKTKMDIPPIVTIFFFNLECVLSVKRLPIIQRQIFETAELCTVEDRTVRLNSAGEQLCTDFIKRIFQAAFATFLVPFAPMTDLTGYADVQMPRHSKILLARHGESQEINAAFVRDFVNSDSEMAAVLYDIVKSYITPYGPSAEETKVLWWTAIAIHTQRVFARKEDTLLVDLREFFSRHRDTHDWKLTMEKVIEFTLKMRPTKKIANGEKLPKKAEELAAEAAEESYFRFFDSIAPIIVDFAISYNQRRNILRDIFDAGQVVLVKMCLGCGYTREAVQLEPSEIAKIERALNASWIPRALMLMEECSTVVLKDTFKVTPLWLEHRFRKFRSMLHVTAIHDRRKQKTLKLIRGDEKNKKDLASRKTPPAVKTNSPASHPAKRKRDMPPPAPNICNNLAVPPEVPLLKKKRLNSPHEIPADKSKLNQSLEKGSLCPTNGKLSKSLIAYLFKYHDIAKVFSMLQASPLTLPLKLSFTLVESLPHSPLTLDQDVMFVPDESREFLGALLSVESWNVQKFTLIVEGDSLNFNSFEEGVKYMENRYNQHFVSISTIAVEDTEIRAWQAFNILPECFNSGAESNVGISRVPLLDFLLMHGWLCCYSGVDITSLLLNLIFSEPDNNVFDLQPRYLHMPRRLVRCIIDNKNDFLPMKPNGQHADLERYRSGQLSFLSLFVKFTTEMVTNGISLPTRSAIFDKNPQQADDWKTTECS